MSKVKTSFFCQNCGTQHAQWMGKCSNCGEWNTIVEEVISKKENNSFWKEDKVSLIEPLDNISIKVEPRIETNDKELNRVLGGGIVLGSLVLIGGDPGVGKSTLMLQVAINLSKKTLYVTGEESKRQIKMRADRLAVENSSCHILTETNDSLREDLNTDVEEKDVKDLRSKQGELSKFEGKLEQKISRYKKEQKLWILNMRARLRSA